MNATIGMDMFGKATKVAKEVGESVKNLGDSLYNSTKEQSDMASLNV